MFWFSEFGEGGVCTSFASQSSGDQCLRFDADICERIWLWIGISTM